MLDREAERELAARARRGDLRARNKLVAHNLALVLSVALRQKLGAVQLDDVIQEGNAGLVRAVETFDPAAGTRFCTYAVWWVRAYIGKYLKQARSAVRPRSNTVALQDVSLDAPIADEEGATHLDALVCGRPGPEDVHLAREGDERVRSALARVGARLRPLGVDIIRTRLATDDPDTLDDVGKRHGVSRERVRQVEVKTKALLERYLPGALDETPRPRVVAVAAAPSPPEPQEAPMETEARPAPAPAEAEELRDEADRRMREMVGWRGPTADDVAAASDEALLARLQEYGPVSASARRARTPAPPPAPVASANPEEPAMPAEERNMPCGTCGKDGHNARSCTETKKTESAPAKPAAQSPEKKPAATKPAKAPRRASPATSAYVVPVEQLSDADLGRSIAQARAEIVRRREEAEARAKSLAELERSISEAA